MAAAVGTDVRGLGPAYAAARARAGLIALLLGLAALAWWSTAHRMAGMDAGPGTALGGLGWFVGVWVVMMAAMMFPSVAPTIALYARMTRRRAPTAPLVFAAGYLLAWTAAGLLAYGLTELGARPWTTRWPGTTPVAGSPAARSCLPPDTSSHRSRTSA